MSDCRHDVQKRKLFRRSSACKTFERCRLTFQEADLTIASTILAVSSVSGSILLYTLIPVRVGLCFVFVFTCAASIVYISFTLSRSYVRNNGLLSLLPDYMRIPLRELLLEKSCMDLINGAHNSGFEKVSDFVVSLTLPMSPRERRKVIKRLSKATQKSLYREGLVHFLPKEVQTALFSEILFKRALPEDGGDSESSQSDIVEPKRKRPKALLTTENVRQHNQALQLISSDGSQDGYDVSPIHLHPSNIPASSVGSQLNNKQWTPIFGGLLDRKMNEVSYQIARNMAKKPFDNLSDRELVYIAMGSGAISCYFVLRSPRLKKIIRKSAFYIFIFCLLAAGSGAVVELLFRSRRLRKKLIQKIRTMQAIFRYSLRTITGTDNAGNALVDQREMPEVN